MAVAVIPELAAVARQFDPLAVLRSLLGVFI